MAAQNAAEAHALLEEARGLVERCEPPASGRSGKRERSELRRSQQQLVDALRGGLIPAAQVPDAAEVLRRSFRLGLSSVAALEGADVEDLSPSPTNLRRASEPSGRSPITRAFAEVEFNRAHTHGVGFPMVVGPWDPPDRTRDAALAPGKDQAHPSVPQIGAPNSVLTPLPPLPPIFPPAVVSSGHLPADAPPVDATLGTDHSAGGTPEVEIPSAADQPKGSPSAWVGVETNPVAIGAPASVGAETPSAIPVAGVRRRVVLTALRFTGIELVLFVLFALYGTAVLQGHAQHDLNASPTALHLSAPVIGLDVVVVRGYTRAELARGPGLLHGSDQPADTRPIVIVGTRTIDGAPFRHLGTLRPDDVITLRDGKRSRTFAVVQLSTTTPRATLAVPDGPQRLYLVTANPPYGDHSRLVVTAQAIVSSDSTGSVPGGVVRLPGFTGSPFPLVLALCVLAALALGWSLLAVNRHRLAWWIRWISWLPLALGSYLCWHLLLDSFSPLL
jgi:LPXTG-site transpeptidase (sortase) family protein